jgi:hypothetical protein
MRPFRWTASSCLAIGLAALPFAALAAEQAGVAAAVRGQVKLARAAIPPRGVASGEQILMQDTLESGPSSGMQILLLDETVFTIGPSSVLTVDEFVYDPSTNAGKVGATVAKGVFRFVTGKIAKRNPSDMNVALPAGTIGVRGTIVAGRVDATTKASLVILLGDSRGNAVGGNSASIEVCNAGACEKVASPGFGVKIDGPDVPPSKPFRVPDAEIEAILLAVANPEGVLEGEAGQLDQAGLPAGEEERAREVRRRLQGLDKLDTLSDRAAQDAARPGPIPTVTQEPVTPPSPTYTPPPGTSGRSPTGKP